jgi:putative nucleotide binding protein
MSSYSTDFRNQDSYRYSSKQKSKQPRMYEEYAYILDILPHGRIMKDRVNRISVPVAQVIGEKYFTLLEVQLRPESSVEINERIYIGKDQRDKVLRVVGRVEYENLSASAKNELVTTLTHIVTDQETKFIAFFNTSSAVTPRMHSLELIPGIGKKYMWQIIREREKKPFTNFEDLKERGGISEPIKLTAKRIFEELSTESKYKIFTRAQ